MTNTTATPPSAGSRSMTPATMVLVGVTVLVAIAAVLAIVLSGGGDDSGDGSGLVGDPIEIGDIVVDGDPLPRLTDPAVDAAVGLPAPEITGLSYTGEQLDIPFDGRPKMIAFLAHWCPHCQRELPQVVSWLDGGGLPEGVDLYVVATGTQSGQPNYPPSEWLVREGLTDVPVIMDDADSTAAAAMGLPGYPYWVAIDSAGLVAFRSSGELSDFLGLPPDDAFAFVAARATEGAA